MFIVIIFVYYYIELLLLSAAEAEVQWGPEGEWGEATAPVLTPRPHQPHAEAWSQVGRFYPTPQVGRFYPTPQVGRFYPTRTSPYTTGRLGLPY